MWVKFMDVPDGYAAIMWRELFHSVPLSVQIVPPVEVGSMRTAREIWVPDGKTHVARETVNKI